MDALEQPEDIVGSVSAADALAEHSRFVADNLKRNYLANFIHGVLGLTGFRLIYAPTIIPAYLQLLTGSTAWVGLGTALLQLGATVSPVASSARIEHRSHILPYAIRVGSLMRVQIAGLALAGWFLTGDTLIAVTMFFFLALGFFTGAQRVAFQMLMAKLIPVRKRGRLQGYRNFAGGIIAAILAYVAGNYFIAQSWFGNGYATTFMFAFVLTSAGLIVLKTMIREPATFEAHPQKPFRERMREFPALLADPNFKAFMLAQCFSTAGRVGAPFWTIYAGNQLGLDGALIGGLSFVFLGSDTVSNILWGPMGDRFGFRLVFALALVCSLAGVLLLMLGDGQAAIYGAFILLGFGGSGWMLAGTTMVLELGTTQDIPMRLAFVTTAEGAIAAIGPIGAGLMVAAFGFTPLFVMVLAALLCALAIIVFSVKEPRNLAKG